MPHGTGVFVRGDCTFSQVGRENVATTDWPGVSDVTVLSCDVDKPSVVFRADRGGVCYDTANLVFEFKYSEQNVLLLPLLLWKC